MRDPPARLVSLARTYAYGLEDIDVPSICPDCLGIFLTTIGNDDSITLLATRCRTFWDALMTFLAIDRTSDNRTSLNGVLLHNRLRCTNCRPPGTKSSGPRQGPADKDLLHGLIVMMSQRLYACLKMSWLQSRPQKPLSKKRRMWPLDVEQVFPHGVAKTMAGMVQWYQLLPAEFFVIVAIVSRYRPLVVSELLSHRVVVLETMIHTLNDTTADADKAVRLVTRQYGDAAPYDRIREALHPCLDRAVCTCELLCSMVNGPNRDEGDTSALLQGYERPLYDAIYGILPYLENGRLFGNDMAMLGAIIHASMGLPDAELPGEMQRALAHKIDELTDPYIMLCVTLPIVARKTACFTCGVERALDARPFPRCARCQLAQYCSRDCQRLDWNREHKAICKILHEISLFADWKVTPPQSFTAACRDHHLPAADAQRVVQWATGIDPELVRQYVDTGGGGSAVRDSFLRSISERGSTYWVV